MKAMEYVETPIAPKKFIKRKWAGRQITDKQFAEVEKLSSWRALCYAGKILKMVYKRHEVGILQLVVAGIFIVVILGRLG